MKFVKFSYIWPACLLTLLPGVTEATFTLAALPAGAVTTGYSLGTLVAGLAAAAGKIYSTPSVSTPAYH